METVANADSSGFDLGQIDVKGKSLEQVYKICQEIPYAVAFNSNGWVKYNVRKQLTNAPGTTLYVIKRPRFTYTASYLPPIWCVNLLRRPDRRQKMIEWENKITATQTNKATNSSLINYYPAVDGKTLKMTDDIKHLFRGNDFGFRCGVVGAAMSHYNLWKQLLAGNSKAYLIVEDDVEFCQDFMAKYSHAMSQMERLESDWGVLYLGFSFYERISSQYHGELWNDKYPLVHPFDDRLCFGTGFFGYVISRVGAQKCVDYIEANGITRAIDCIPQMDKTIKRFATTPNLIQTPIYGPGTTDTDTDIQNDYTVVS